MGDAGYGCVDPSGGILLADKALRAVQDLAVKFGARLEDGVEVEEIRPDKHTGLVSLRATDGTVFTGKSVVVCPGPWAGQILHKLGIRNIPLREGWAQNKKTLSIFLSKLSFSFHGGSESKKSLNLQAK